MAVEAACRRGRKKKNENELRIGGRSQPLNRLTAICSTAAEISAALSFGEYHRPHFPNMDRIDKLNGVMLDVLCDKMTAEKGSIIEEIAKKLRAKKIAKKVADLVTEHTLIDAKTAGEAAMVLLALGSARSKLLERAEDGLAAAVREIIPDAEGEARPGPIPHAATSDDDDDSVKTATPRDGAPAWARELAKAIASATAQKPAAQAPVPQPLTLEAVGTALGVLRLVEDDAEDYRLADVPRDAVDRYNALVRFVAASGTGASVHPAVAGPHPQRVEAFTTDPIIDILAAMGRTAATAALSHRHPGPYVAASDTAQGRWRAMCALPEERSLGEALAGRPEWPPLGPGDALPTRDYRRGWAQWGLYSALRLTSHPAGRPMARALQEAILPPLEAVTPYRPAPQALSERQPNSRRRARAEPGAAPPAAKRPPTAKAKCACGRQAVRNDKCHRCWLEAGTCATPGCGAKSPVGGLCTPCFRRRPTEPKSGGPGPTA